MLNKNPVDSDDGDMFDLAVTLGLMFFGAYGAGYVPYAFDIHESQISTLASLGGGLMVGSSLAVIVPEGFHAFQGHNEHEDDVGSVDVDDHNHSDEMPDGYAGMALVTGFLAMLILDQVQQQHQGSSKDSHGCCGPGHKKAMEGEGTVDAVDVSSGDVVGEIERCCDSVPCRFTCYCPFDFDLHGVVWHALLDAMKSH